MRRDFSSEGDDRYLRDSCLPVPTYTHVVGRDVEGGHEVVIFRLPTFVDPCLYHVPFVTSCGLHPSS